MSSPRVIIIVGSAVAAIGLGLILSTITPAGYETTTGAITNETFDNGGRRSSNYKRDITFETRRGEVVTVTNRTYSTALRTSNKVAVAYNPENPHIAAKVLSDNGVKQFWGAFMLLMGGSIAWLGLRQLR